MEHLHIPHIVGLLVVMLAAAKMLGALAQRSGVLTPGLFSAATVMVLVTTFMAPPLLRHLWPPGPPTPPPPAPEGLEELVMEP
jgi:hypothetical protein